VRCCRRRRRDIDAAVALKPVCRRSAAVIVVRYVDDEFFGSALAYLVSLHDQRRVPNIAMSRCCALMSAANGVEAIHCSDIMFGLAPSAGGRRQVGCTASTLHKVSLSHSHMDFSRCGCKPAVGCKIVHKSADCTGRGFLVHRSRMSRCLFLCGSSSAMLGRISAIRRQHDMSSL